MSIHRSHDRLHPFGEERTHSREKREFQTIGGRGVKTVPQRISSSTSSLERQMVRIASPGSDS